VPVADLVLAEAPAEEDRLAVAERGKVDQALVEVLHLGTAFADLVDEQFEPAGNRVHVGGRGGELGGRDAAAVALDLALQLLLACECRDVLPPPPNEPLDERPNLGENGIRLLGREVAHRTNPILRSVHVEAVTIDAFGTLVTLDDPVPRLQAALRRRGAERSREDVASAFAAEVDYYVPLSHEGRDEATLALLRRDCTAVFLAAARVDLDADTFTADFLDSLVFRVLPGAEEACRALKEHGIRLAVVSNWDVGLHARLIDLGLDRLLDAVVTSAEAAAPKPAPAIWRLALERLGSEAECSVHVGDSEADAEGAHAAGLRFEPAPLADAVGRILA
jgi:HAD superfamily hydrolase (TIGR01509 family)